MNRLAFFLSIAVFSSCLNQNNNSFVPEVDLSIYEQNDIFDLDSIIENDNLPQWLFAYFAGSNAAVERLEAFRNKYIFIGENEGLNLQALERWAGNYSPSFDFPMLAAARVERRMIATSSLYPDDEYGAFFEAMVKNASGTLYPGAEKTESHWVRYLNYDSDETVQKYKFFILITIDRSYMQVILRDVMTRSNSGIRVTPAQNIAINRLRQNFFEGF
ncbi:MAG: hypothetical protein FWC01_02160 [Treponema sp.]|nr:hypothetical protein [Treponema sp.]MCL2236863.1 hypothetical protein [Treponema sp.]